MAKVFISYSRKDTEFARKLTDELKKSEMDFWVDWEGIPPTVDWWKEIEKGIEEADAFLFLISPDSSASKVCGEEIDCAVKNSKRIIPLVVREVSGAGAPKQLSHLNWIFFRAQDDFDAAIQKLLTAIHTDYEWLQAHRKLQNKALEWERGGKNQSYLLRGVNLTQAETNLAVNTSTAPHPTDLMREYVFASRKATDRQRGITTGLSIAAGVALALLAVYGFVQAGLAKAEARRATAGQLALESKSALEKYPQRALLLALESVRISQDADEPVLTEAEEALRLANERVSGYGLTSFINEPSIIQFTKDGKWLLAGTQYGGEARLWNVQKITEDPVYEPFSISFEVDMDDDDSWNVENGLIKFSANETWLMVNATKSGSGLWKVDVEDENRTPILFDGKIEFLNPDDEMVILEKQADAVVLWQVDAVEVSKKEIQRLPGKYVRRSENGQYILTNDPETGIQIWDISTSPATMMATLTEPGFLAKSAFFDGDYRWLVLVQNEEHPDIQVDNGYMGEADTWVTVMEPWASNNFLVYSMDDLNAKPVFLEIGTMLYEQYYSDNGVVLNSPNREGFFYYGEKLNVNMDRSVVAGYLDLSGDIPVNTTLGEGFSPSGFISNNFILVDFLENENASYEEKFLDLRDMSLVDNPGENFNQYLEFYVSKDGRYAGTGVLMLDIKALEEDREVKIMPIRPALFNLPEKAEQSKFETSLWADPKAFGMEDSITMTSTSPDGRWFVAGAYDGSLRLWDNNSPLGDTQITISVEEKLWSSVTSLSNDDRWLFIDNTLWTLGDGRPTRAYSPAPKDENIVMSVFSPDARWLVTGSMPTEYTGNENIHFSLIDLQKTLETSELAQEEVKSIIALGGSLQFSADSRWFFVNHATSFLYNLETGAMYDFPYTPSQSVFHEDGRHFVLLNLEYDGEGYIGSEAKILTLPDESGNVETAGSLKTDDQSRLYASQNGRWLVAVPYDSDSVSDVKLWSVDCILEKSACEPLVFQTNRAAFSRDSLTFLTGIEQGDQLNYEVWSLSTRTPKRTFSSSAAYSSLMMGNTAQWMVFSDSASEGKAFLSSSWVDTPYNFITTYDGYGTYSLSGGGGGGGNIGTYQKDYAVQAFAPSEEQYINLRGHESNISLNVISPDERYLITYSGGLQDDDGASENVLRLWDMNAMQENPKKRGVILPYVGEASEEYPDLTFGFSSFFAPGGDWIYTIESRYYYVSEVNNGYIESILHYTPTSIEVLKEQACQKVGRNFIINEWERFFPDDAYRKTCENFPEHPSAVATP